MTLKMRYHNLWFFLCDVVTLRGVLITHLLGRDPQGGNKLSIEDFLMYQTLSDCCITRLHGCVLFLDFGYVLGTSSSLSCLEMEVARAEVARAEVARAEVPRQQSSAGSLGQSGRREWVADLLIEMHFIRIRALMVGFGDALK